MYDDVEFRIELEHHGLDSKLFVLEQGIQTHPFLLEIPEGIEDNDLRGW